jgi:hypothetical protein
MYSFSVDLQPWLVAAFVIAMILAIVERYRSVRRHNRNEEVRRTLRRFAKVAQDNGHPEASGAYDNASHIVGLMLQRDTDVEPALTLVPAPKVEGVDSMSSTNGTSRVTIDR